MIEPILIAALCGVFFMLGRNYDDFMDALFTEEVTWEHPTTGVRITWYD